MFVVPGVIRSNQLNAGFTGAPLGILTRYTCTFIILQRKSLFFPLVKGVNGMFEKRSL